MSRIDRMKLCEIEVAMETEAVFANVQTIPNFETWHSLHAGIYTRTVVLKAGEAIVGALIKIPTTLKISGVMNLYIGGDVIKIDGTEVIAAAANRKQVMYAISDTLITMIFKTEATTIEGAESEFTDDAYRLISRLPSSVNHITLGDI